jgi:two-component system, LytTR family, response regulator LytT
MKAVIVDDNMNVINAIKGAIEKEFEASGMDVSVDAFSSVKSFKDHMMEYDLYFLDIKMPEEDGVELAEEIKKLKKESDIIFISSREERVFDTFKVSPFAFIRKSNFLLDASEVIQRYARLKCNVTASSKEVSFISHGTRINVPLADIAYIEGQGGHQAVYFTDMNKEVMYVSSKMEDLEKELYDDGFIRSHKGYLVNFRFIKSINQDLTITLKDNRVVIVSRRKVAFVKQRFLELCKENDILLF